MTQPIRLKISSKELKQEVNYNSPITKIKLNNNDEGNDFLIKDVLKEVKQTKKKDLKKYVKVASLLLTTLGTFSLTGFPASAEMVATAIPVATNATDVLLPKDIVEIGKYLIGICAAISFVLSIILLQLAGGYRMLRKKKESVEWTIDILKGFFQTLIAPVLIVTIALACYLLFGSFEWFVKPF